MKPLSLEIEIAKTKSFEDYVKLMEHYTHDFVEHLNTKTVRDTMQFANRYFFTALQIKQEGKLQWDSLANNPLFKKVSRGYAWEDDAVDYLCKKAVDFYNKHVYVYPELPKEKMDDMCINFQDILVGVASGLFSIKLMQETINNNRPKVMTEKLELGGNAVSNKKFSR